MGDPVAFSPSLSQEAGSGPTAVEHQAAKRRQRGKEGVTHSPERKQMHKNVSAHKLGGGG